LAEISEDSAEQPAGRAGQTQLVVAALRLFASVFEREVSADLLGQIEARRQPLIGVLGGDPLAGLEQHETGAAIEALAVEYCRLFIGPTGHLPPVESVVLGEGRFWGPSTETVAKFYKVAGLAPRQQTRVFPDHLSMELDCLAILEEAGLHEDADAFAREHPLRWLPRLAEHVAANATMGFYPAWCKGLLSMLEDLYGCRPPSGAGQ